MNPEPAVAFRYYRGYPARYVANLRHAVFFSATALFPFVLIGIGALIGVLYYGKASWTAGTLQADWGLPACLGILAFSACQFRGLSDIFQARIVLYFRVRVGHTDSFHRGCALARHCREMDELATKLGVPPVSSYGFIDEFDGETIRWYPAEDGLRTFKALMEIPQSRLATLGDEAEIMQDLRQISQSLESANAKSVEFCLILRQGSDRMISGYEMSCRKGSFH